MTVAINATELIGEHIILKKLNINMLKVSSFSLEVYARHSVILEVEKDRSYQGSCINNCGKWRRERFVCSCAASANQKFLIVRRLFN